MHEGALEKRRRDLALRQDFNICDLYKMFLGLRLNKPGIENTDVYAMINDNLELPLTKDEVFIIFCKVDKDGDSLWSISELAEAFCPREHEYKSLVDSRGGLYGEVTSPKEIFELETRETLKKYIRGFCETEI